MKQKKLMLLGGSHYLIPAIETAHKLGVCLTSMCVNMCKMFIK
jgi:hypothetical protein